MTRIFALLAALTTAAVAQAPVANPPTGPTKPASTADADSSAPAASPAQNRAAKQLPPRGIAIPEQDRAELTSGALELLQEIDALASALGDDKALLALLPDVEIFHKAVDWPLRYDEFYNLKEVATARELLKMGRARAAALREGKAPWTTQTGPVARGFRSRIDGSIQPYGVVVPSTWEGTADKKKRATWIWNHGRGETLTELAFVNERSKKPGEFSPADTFVVHPYGRYCNATKFAGETDVFEALAAARRAYPVDDQRLVNAGFSMGGASAWHLGAHYASGWAVSHAGAGFAETAEYAGVFAPGKTPPPWWEQILFRWYDATACAANFSQSPAIAYHGSEDKQGQATAIMKRFAEKEGVTIEEFVGPGVGHKYEPKTKREIIEKISAVLEKGRVEPLNFQITAYCARYLPNATWIRVSSLERQWERADLKIEVAGDTLKLTTKNVAAVDLEAAVDERPEIYKALTQVKQIVIDGQTLEGAIKSGLSAKPNARSSKSVVGNLEKTKGKWGESADANRPAVKKRFGLAGPIDDAFMERFVFVKPTGAPLTPALGEWTQRELAHAVKQWRGIFRGDALMVDDARLAETQIQSSNLVLWGDRSSNAVLKKIAGELPVKWTAEGVEFGGKKYGPTHVPILIFPNPLNPAKYVVLNSGFTFNRAAASGTNSLQTPKLPDWAILDTSVAPDDKYPGKVVDAGFFDEAWKFTTDRPK